jgi:hypothetical protein
MVNKYVKQEVYCRNNHVLIIPCAFKMGEFCGEDGKLCGIIKGRYIFD